jgi:hypothetical protein
VPSALSANCMALAMTTLSAAPVAPPAENAS